MGWFGPQAGTCTCCGPCVPPSCTLNGVIIGSNIVLTWVVSGKAITSAVITNENGDSYTLTVPPNSGTLSVPKMVCRQWVLTVINACGTSTCTFNESNCTILGLRTSPCTTCTNTDYPASLLTPRQAKISISGVTVGNNTAPPNYYNCSAPSTGNGFFSEPNPGAIYLTNPDCERNAMAANTGFFNSDFTLDPCTEVWLYNCRYICSSLYTGFFTFPFQNNDYFEWNVLNVSYQKSAGAWDFGVDLHSWVAYYQRPTSGTICSSVGSPFGGPPVNNNTQKLLQAPGHGGIYGWLSYRRKAMGFQLIPGVKKGYFYDPAYCDTECNHDIDLARCLASGDATSTPALSYSQTCPNEKALNVNAATALVTIL